MICGITIIKIIENTCCCRWFSSSDKAFEYAASMIHDHKQQLLIVHIIENLGNIRYSYLNQLKQDSPTILKNYKTKA